MDAASEPTSPPPITPPSPGLAIACLVLGILAVTLSVLLIGGLLGVIGIILGVVHLRHKPGPHGMARWGVALSVTGLLAAVSFGALYFHAYNKFKQAMASDREGADVSTWEGVLAPDFTITSLDGKQIRLSELKGKRVVLDFWATWCPPCVKEIPHFIEMSSQTSRDNVVIIGISSEAENVLKPFVKQKGMNYPVASAANLPSPYSDVQSIPTTFFIDRQGVIQSVLVGYHDLATLKDNATKADFKGEPKAQPAAPKSGLKDGEHQFKPVMAWTTNIAGACALCTGDWDGNGGAEILVADRTKRLHVLALDGSEEASLALPDRFSLIELGRHKQHGSRLLGYSNWGQQVSVMDRDGKLRWTYTTSQGVDGAHWGDLDGDGTDEMIVGMNGGGGLHAVSADGKPLWQYTGIGNVWNQAVIPARGDQPAVVFATEAGGTVKVFDPRGKLLRTVRPLGKYCAQMSVLVAESTGAVQAVAIGGGMTIAFTPAGEVAWSTPAIENHGAWRNISFACGDLTGGGIPQWAFLEASGNLVIATMEGERLSSIPAQRGVESFAIASAPKRKGVLVTLKAGVLQAYSFE